MTPYFFPPPFHCRLSEKEIQLECLSDGEIGSVVFRSFSILCLSSSLRFQPSLLPVSFVCFGLFLSNDAWGVAYDRLRLVRFSVHPASVHPLLLTSATKTFSTQITHTHAHTLTSFQLSYSDVWPICQWIGSGILAYLPTSLNITGATRDILIIVNISIKSFPLFFKIITYLLYPHYFSFEWIWVFFSPLFLWIK